jgi:hypothetical protein
MQRQCSEYQFNQLPDGGKMKVKEQYEVSKLQRDIDKLADVAYEQYCSTQLAIDALEQIVNVPYSAASDSRALKEVIRIATEALNVIKEPA